MTFASVSSHLPHCAAVFCVTVVLLTLTGCGGSETPNAPTVSVVLRGAVTDSAGDSLSAPQVPVSPDLVAGSVDVSDGSVTLTISFAPGTLSPTQTLFVANFDTDENAATGFAAEPGILGVDYFVRGVIPRNSTQATLARATASEPCSAAVPCPVVGTATVTFPAPDQARVIFPLAMFGNDDGRMSFKVLVEQWVSDTQLTATLDNMPDRGQSAGSVR